MIDPHSTVACDHTNQQNAMRPSTISTHEKCHPFTQVFKRFAKSQAIACPETLSRHTTAPPQTGSIDRRTCRQPKPGRFLDTERKGKTGYVAAFHTDRMAETNKQILFATTTVVKECFGAEKSLTKLRKVSSLLRGEI